ncbi:hypothetical protein [Limnohabitans sp.]|uniref:hypothetical protein n=1 Tax=Limnohabitans sp. TaxID=1907725 RepID=UPI00286F3396|nr:hypothetical protein [Limnohabitans sp.]
MMVSNMRYVFKFALILMLQGPQLGHTQMSQAFPLESKRCDSLLDHAAIQECIKRGQAQGQEWDKQIKERYFPAAPKLNGQENKTLLNCFKRESTGEQVCAN